MAYRRFSRSISYGGVDGWIVPSFAFGGVVYELQGTLFFFGKYLRCFSTLLYLSSNKLWTSVTPHSPTVHGLTMYANVSQAPIEASEFLHWDVSFRRLHVKPTMCEVMVASLSVRIRGWGKRTSNLKSSTTHDTASNRLYSFSFLSLWPQGRGISTLILSFHSTINQLWLFMKQSSLTWVVTLTSKLNRRQHQ